MHKEPAALAINHDASEEEGIAFGTAINIAPIDVSEDDWIDISPYGEFPNEQGTQEIDRSAADEMVTNFNSFTGKLGRLFRGIPIYRGHPYQRPDLWPDDTRYGRVNELRAGEQTLQGKVAWNDLGQKNKEQGYWVYPSPGWNFKRLPNGKIKPFRLDHIGLTNNPNILESVPVTNARISAAPAKSEQPETESKTNIMDKTKLIAALGLKAEATDEEIETAINALKEEKANLATNAQSLNTAKAQADAATEVANAAAKKFKKLAIEHKLDLAVNDGRLTAAELPAWGTKFESDFDAAAKDLKEKQAALNTKGLNLRPNGRDLSDASKRRVAFNSRLDELMQPDRDGRSLSMKEAIAKMNSNDEDRALLEAMNQPVAA